MPLPLLGYIAKNGIDSIPYLSTILRTLPVLALIGLIKWWTSGTVCKVDRLMKSKVIILTGGTSGIGASLARSLATKGASLILLTSQPPSDPFIVDYIDDLRRSTNNQLIYAEQVNLGSLHSIRQFATKWIDNTPPRRLDMVILCAATVVPPFAVIGRETSDGVEACWGINYLANFHLLSILSPAIRAQPPDRDVRVIMTTCTSYFSGNMALMNKSKSPLPQGLEYATSKLALMTFAQSFQRHLEAYIRPDKAPNNARVILVDPGTCRTPGTRRWLTLGHLWGLAMYVLLWPVWWLVFKSAEGGAESILTAVQDPGFSAGLISKDALDAESKMAVSGTTASASAGYVKMVRECVEVSIDRPEVFDEMVGKELWAFTEKQIIALEKEGAMKRSQETKKKKAEAEVEENQQARNGPRIVELDENDEPVSSGKEVNASASVRSRK